jgi:hypothetical protein
MYAKDILYIENHAEVLADATKIAEMRERIKDGHAYIARGVVPKEKLLRIREYLRKVGQSSLPNYQKIEKGCPNSHRMNDWDPRAYVQGCFHQFSFFPWNQDLHDVFKVSRDIFRMRNLLAGLPPEKFLGKEPEDGCTARISFQFYPRGTGGLNRHQDPYDFHQLSVPTLMMSKKGVDFKKGGAYVVREGGEVVLTDELMEIGDVLYFNSLTPHGVEKVDSDQSADWPAFEGRWIMLVAVNRLAENTSISNAVDLEKK